MAIRVRNSHSSPLPLPYPLRAVLEPGKGIVLALTAEQFAALAGPTVSVYEVDEVADLAGDDFALSTYNGAYSGEFSDTPLKIKTVTGAEKDWGTITDDLEIDLALSQFHRVTLDDDVTLTFARAEPEPDGVGHFTLVLLGTDTNTVIITGVVFTGAGPDFAESPAWVVSLYADGAGVIRASALPFAS